MFGDMTALEGLHVRNNELPFPGSLISTFLASRDTATRELTRTQMIPSIILHQTTKSIFVAYSERELTFEVNLATNLGVLTFKLLELLEL